MPQVIRVEAPDVVSRLTELGLAMINLSRPVEQGMRAFSECTPNDAPLFPGFSAWAMAVRGLREQLLPKWSRSNEGGYPLVISPEGKLAIAVATGNEDTGNPNANPTTKSPKGPRTQSAVEVNQYVQNSLFEDFEIPDTPHSDRVTWILLQYYDQAKKEVRFELSLPNSYSGKVDGWSERIILGTLPFDPAASIPVPVLPDQPDIDVPLRRRA